eukprot:Hpha_TRINITY_DN16268_c2_g1::TRINITY_DN16268_c2_g1_i1::g.11904::m.11904
MTRGDADKTVDMGADDDSDSEYDWMFMSDIRKVKSGGPAGKPNYDDMSAWTKYDADTSLTLEKHYLGYVAAGKPKSAVSQLVTSGKVEYIVQFDDGEGGMRQFRKSDRSLQRPVQRRKRESAVSTPRAKVAVKRKEGEAALASTPAKKKRGGGGTEDEEYVWYFMHDIRKVKLGGSGGKPNYEDLSAWTKYDDVVSKKLEAGYQTYQEAPTKKNKTLTVRGVGKKIAYVVCFDDEDGAMRQWRSDDPERQRPVQRRVLEDGIPVPSPKK